MKAKHIILLLCVLLFVTKMPGQNHAIDSLEAKFHKTTDDTLKLQLLIQLFLEYEFTDLKKAKESIDGAYEIARKLNDKKGLILTYTHLGFFAEDQGNFPQASIYYEKCLQLAEELKDPINISAAFTNLGNICYQTSDYPRALEYYFKGLQIDEKIKNEQGISFSLNNIALVYESNGEYSKALDYFLRSVKIKEKLNDKKGIAASLSNIGIIHNKLGDYEKALDFGNRSLNIYEELHNEPGIAYILDNISEIYLNLIDTCKNAITKEQLSQKTLASLDRALSIAEIMNDNVRIASLLNKKGAIYIEQAKFKEAENALIKALNISEKAGILNLISENSNALSELYSRCGKDELALSYYKKYITYKDSIYNEANTRKNVQAQMNYDFQKKEAAARSEQEKLDAIAMEEKEKQAIIRNLFIGGFGLLLVLAIMIFRGYRNKQKANIIISKQKEEVERAKQLIETQKQVVEEKQKEILDSIYYAQRIQKALITPEKYFQKHLNKDH